MTDITVDRDPGYAPCAYLICKVDAEGKWNTRDEENTVLVQMDWGFPSLASTFGWMPCHDTTDGTIDCPECGRSAGELISSARLRLDVISGTGQLAEDPGYFDG